MQIKTADGEYKEFSLLTSSEQEEIMQVSDNFVFSKGRYLKSDDKKYTEQAKEMFEKFLNIKDKIDQKIFEFQDINKLLSDFPINNKLVDYLSGSEIKILSEIYLLGADVISHSDPKQSLAIYKDLAKLVDKNLVASEEFSRNCWEKYVLVNQQFISLEDQLKNIQLRTEDANKSREGQFHLQLELGAIYKLQNNLEQMSDSYAKAYLLSQGSIDHEAYRVEQHTYGITVKDKIGTDNVKDCITFIIWDPKSHKSGMAHIDVKAFQDNVSIENMMKNFDDNVEYSAFIIGATNSKVHENERASFNIEQLKKQILERYSNVKIDPKDIYLNLNADSDKKIPSAIVFNPNTGTLEDAVPGKFDDTTFLRQLLPRSGGLMEKIFDFSDGNYEIYIPKFSEEQIGLIIEEFYMSGIDSDSDSLLYTSACFFEPISKVAEYIRLSNKQDLIVDKLISAISYEISLSIEDRGLSIDETKINLDQVRKLCSDALERGKKMSEVRDLLKIKVSEIIDEYVQENIENLATADNLLNIGKDLSLHDSLTDNQEKIIGDILEEV